MSTEQDHLSGLKCKQVPLEVLCTVVNTTGVPRTTKMVHLLPSTVTVDDSSSTGDIIYCDCLVMFSVDWLFLLGSVKANHNAIPCLYSSFPIRSQIVFATNLLYSGSGLWARTLTTDVKHYAIQ